MRFFLCVGGDLMTHAHTHANAHARTQNPRLPQIAQSVTRTIASVSCSSAGLGTRVCSMRCLPWNVSAHIMPSSSSPAAAAPAAAAPAAAGGCAAIALCCCSCTVCAASAALSSCRENGGRVEMAAPRRERHGRTIQATGCTPIADREVNALRAAVVALNAGSGARTNGGVPKTLCARTHSRSLLLRSRHAPQSTHNHSTAAHYS